MLEFIKDFINKKDILSYIYRILVISFGTLGLVYIGGRLLEVLKKDKAKNKFAVFCFYAISVGTYFYSKKNGVNITYKDVWEIFICGSIAAVPYITFCWRLFDRIDSLLDRKGLRDKKHRGWK